MSTTEATAVTVAVDAMGGDYAPEAIVAGALSAARADAGLSVVLVGDEDAIMTYAGELPPNARIHAASQTIAMSEHPAMALREKPDASIVAAAKLVKEGEAQAFVSAGNTGAAMAAALLHLGRIEGVARPAIAVVVPLATGPVVLLDAGANADSKAEYMAQFGIMGSAYASCVLGVDNPKVGLLNIGQEKSKGSQLYQAAHDLLDSTNSINFIGNVEGRDFFQGKADVIVADGFVGNVALKVAEGLSEMLFSELKATIADSVIAKLGGFLLRSGLEELKAKLDYEEYGGAQLLGVRGFCVIAHGGSRAKAIANAVRVAARVVRNDVVQTIATQIR